MICYGGPVAVSPGSPDKSSAAPAARNKRSRDCARASRLRSMAVVWPRSMSVQHRRCNVCPNFRTTGVPCLIGFRQDGQAGSSGKGSGVSRAVVMGGGYRRRSWSRATMLKARGRAGGEVTGFPGLRRTSSAPAPTRRSTASAGGTCPARATRHRARTGPRTPARHASRVFRTRRTGRRRQARPRCDRVLVGAASRTKHFAGDFAQLGFIGHPAVLLHVLRPIECRAVETAYRSQMPGGWTPGTSTRRPHGRRLQNIA